ncbi:MAG TPA: type IV pili methyl-accepting chemotaxis transducer N-terminal domain-containing protein [Burkholderiales bacterium]|nr:type IV pili methyl-accepting chemotaxis transducer N-terminal domain-containing protein [Burkholderiales bacterium]
MNLINKAGRQRMLGQRIVKSYVLLAAEAPARSARGELSAAIWSFDRQLGELGASADDDETRTALASSEREWQRFRALAMAPCTRVGVLALRSAGERLLQAAEQTTAAFAKRTASAAVSLVNLAGRQRMLSQRIAKNYVLLEENYDNAATRQELTQACVDFGRALGELRASPFNSGELRDELGGVAVSWRFLLELVRQGVGVREQVLAAADDILGRMERITSLYQQ